MKAVVFGGGNIGRGFLGQLLYESGFETVFIDVDKELIDKLNEDKSYPIRIVCNEYQKEILIKNVRAVHSNEASKEIENADIIFTCVGVKVLPIIAPILKKGLMKRTRGVDIIICENLLDAHIYLKSLINIDSDNIGFAEASVGRMVPIMNVEMREGLITRVWVEPYCILPVDKDGFKNEIPKIKGMVPSAPFDYYIHQKLYIHNLGHAIIAYLGIKNGYTYIWQAMEDKDIYDIAKNAMYSSAKALHSEHNKPLEEIIQYVEDLLLRFKNKYLSDTTSRVGRDVLRKLSPGDRFLGAIRLCQKHNVDTYYIKCGINAALDYIYEEEKNKEEMV